MTRKGFERLRLASAISYVLFLTVQILGYIFIDNHTIRSLIGGASTAAVLLSYGAFRLLGKKIRELREEEFLADVPDILNNLFLKYDFYKFKRKEFVDGYFKQELFDELNHLKAKHRIETDNYGFYYDIDDDRYDSKKLDVVIETTLLDFSLYVRVKNKSSKMFRVQKQINALSIS